MRSRPRITYLAAHWPPTLGGLETFLERTGEALAQHASVEVLARRHSGAPRADGLRRAPLPSLAGYLAWAYLEARSLPTDLVVSGSGVTVAVGALVARRLGVPLLALATGLDMVYERAIYRRQMAWGMAHAHRTLAISRRTAELARAAGARDVFVLPPPVAWPEPRTGRETVRHRRGWQRRRVLLSLGRLVRRKGLCWFVDEVLSAVVRQVPEVLLAVAGGETEGLLRNSGGVVEALRDAVRTRGLEAHVQILGRVDEATKADLVAAADLFVLPAVPVPGDVEGFGMTLAEAAGAGLPGVASDLGGIPDALGDGAWGRLVPAGDAAAWGQAVVDLLRDDAGRERLAEAGRREVGRTLGPAVFGCRLWQEVDLLIGRRGPRPASPPRIPAVPV